MSDDTKAHSRNNPNPNSNPYVQHTIAKKQNNVIITDTQTWVQADLSNLQTLVPWMRPHLFNNRPLRNFPAVRKETAEPELWMKCHEKEERRIVTGWRFPLWRFLLSTAKREDLELQGDTGGLLSHRKNKLYLEGTQCCLTFNYLHVMIYVHTLSI